MEDRAKRVSKLEINYPMRIAGKLRLIPELRLYQSRFDPQQWVLKHSDFKQISIKVAQEICSNQDLLTIEEVEFLSQASNASKNEINDVVALIEIKNGLTESQSVKLKQFFKQKLEISL